MPRSLVVGNGNLLVNFDADYNIREIYYPFVGTENHAEGRVSRTGIWVDGGFAWIDSPDWQKEMLYEQDSLVTKVTVSNPAIGLILTFSDAVDFDKDIFLRHVDIINQEDRPRDVRLFFHYQLRISGSESGDTAYYHPKHRSVIIYRGQRYFLINGQTAKNTGIDDWTMWSEKLTNREEALPEIKDGVLTKRPIAWGSAECIIGLCNMAIPAKGESSIFHWLAASTCFHGVEKLNAFVQESEPSSLINRTRDYWRGCANKESMELADLPASLLELYKRSLLTIRLQTNNHGAIVASTDTSVIDVLGDTYCCVWGRDGAFAAMALGMANFDEVSRGFYEFCANTITSDGYLLHKYYSDGCLAASWLPWIDKHDNLQLAIEEDETALVLCSLWYHYDKFHDTEFIRSLYQRLIKNAADFMVSYREPHTNLPAPSYDLWEERRGIHSFTVAAVWAGLQAAANLAEILGEVETVEQYRQAAAEIKEAAIKYLFDRKLGRFLRSISVNADGDVEPDYTIDSSVCGLFLFGMLQATDPLIKTTMTTLIDKIWCKTKMGGMARKENDHYQQISQDITNVPGNPWVICTMWVAQYYIARAQSLDDLRPARDVLCWAQHCALSSGILAEQIHPYTCEPLSVSPLTWSHAAFVIAVHEYINKYRELQA